VSVMHFYNFLFKIQGYLLKKRNLTRHHQQNDSKSISTNSKILCDPCSLHSFLAATSDLFDRAFTDINKLLFNTFQLWEHRMSNIGCRVKFSVPKIYKALPLISVYLQGKWLVDS
jgi:hypothetical protein